MHDTDIVTERNRSVPRDRYAPYYLSVLNSRLSWGASQLYLNLFDLGLNEWRILSALRNDPGLQAQRVCETVAMNKSLVSRSTRALESRGLLVTRMAEGRRQLWLTPAGAEMHDRIIDIALQREAALLDGIDGDDRAALFDLLQRLVDNMEKVADLDHALMGD